LSQKLPIQRMSTGSRRNEQSSRAGDFESESELVAHPSGTTPPTEMGRGGT
jgi:hypothetical protein